MPARLFQTGLRLRGNSAPTFDGGPGHRYCELKARLRSAVDAVDNPELKLVICRMRSYLKFVDGRGLPEEHRQMLLWKNAVKLFKPDVPDTARA